MQTNYDLIIVGAGPAGIGAGVVAIEAGLKTLIIHADSVLGGQATNIYVGTICGVHNRFNADNNLVSNFAREFTEHLARKSETKPVVNKIGLAYLPYKREAFLDLSAEILNSCHLKIESGTKVNKVSIEDRAITSLQIENKHTATTVAAPMFIDCSGNGILSILAGAHLIEEEDYQQSSIILSLIGIKEKDEQVLKLSLYKDLEQGFRADEIKVDGKCLNFVTGTTSTYSDEIYFKFKTIKPRLSYKEEVCELKRVLDFIKTKEMFSEISLGFLSSTKGIRSSSRPLGISVLKDEMVTESKKSKDSIARGIWPVELWKGPKSPIIEHLKDDSYYDIPYSCLQSASLKNLLSAGRAISSEEKAHSSARVIGTALQTGNAAGFLASALAQGQNIQEAVNKYQYSAGFK